MKRENIWKSSLFLTLMLLGMASFSAQTQKYKASDTMDRISLQVGCGFNYTMWGGFQKSFKSQAISAHASGMLGYRFRDNRSQNKVAGVFVTYGNVSGIMTDRTVDFNHLDLEHRPEATGDFFETEVGLISDDWRFSGGYGAQQIDLRDGGNHHFDYYLLTIGGSPSYRNVKVIMGLSMLFGQDVRKVSFRPSLGIAYRLDFLKSLVRRAPARRSYPYNRMDN